MLHSPTLFYLFLDPRLPARKEGRLFRTLPLRIAVCRLGLHAHERFHRCVRCEMHAGLPCICIHVVARYQHLPRTSAAIIHPYRPVQTAATLIRPMRSSRHRPSGAVRSRKSTSTQGHRYAISRTHESRQQLRILHRPSENFGRSFKCSPHLFLEYEYVVSRSHAHIHPPMLLTTTVTVTNVPAFMHALAGDD